MRSDPALPKRVGVLAWGTQPRMDHGAFMARRGRSRPASGPDRRTGLASDRIHKALCASARWRRLRSRLLILYPCVQV